MRRGFALPARQRGGHARRRRGRCAAQCTAGLLCAPRACALTQPLAFGVRSGGAQHFAKTKVGGGGPAHTSSGLAKAAFYTLRAAAQCAAAPSMSTSALRLWPARASCAYGVRCKARRFCGNPMDGSGIAACSPSSGSTKAPSANQCPPHNAQPASHAVHLLPHSRFCAMK